MKNRPLVSAALLGLGGGLRSFAPPVALALRGRGPLAGPARFIAFGAAAGELIADKQPQMSSRLGSRGLALRLGFSSSGGRDLGGWQGAGVATVAALAAMFAGSWLRGKVHGRPAQLTAAVAEDALSYGLVLAAVRKHGQGSNAKVEVQSPAPVEPGITFRNCRKHAQASSSPTDDAG